MIGIYKITNPNGVIYIGQSRNILRRRGQYSRNACKNQLYLYRSLTKYGFKNHKFEIIHDLPIDVEQIVIDKYEQFYLDLYKQCGVGLLNIKEAGANGRHSEETKLKIGKSNKNKISWIKGKTHSAETREKLSNKLKGHTFTEASKNKISKSLTGKKQSEETKKKRIQNRLGKPLSAEHKSKLSKAHTGKKMSIEAVEKMRQNNLGRKCSDETKKKMSEAHMGMVVNQESIKKQIQTRKQNGSNTHSEETKAKMRYSHLGIKRPDISAKLKGRKQSKDHIEKRMESIKRRKDNGL